jgi:hypothetical protein
MLKSIETMNDILGSNYQIVSSGNVDPIVIAKIPGEDLASKTAKDKDQTPEYKKDQDKDTFTNAKVIYEKTTDDYLFQMYIGSLTVVGLFVLFRMIQKSR